MNSSLAIYYSKDNLTTRFVDYSNVYFLPFVCLFGVITSFLCLLVTYKRDDSNGKTLDYIRINSAIDFIFLFIESFLFIIRCGTLCPYGYTYASKFYEIYIYLYFGYILVTSQVFLNIYVTYDRLRMFSGKLGNQKRLGIYQVYVICVFISAIANALPYLISKTVSAAGIYMSGPNSSSQDILYIRTMRKEFDTPFFQDLLTTIMAIKDPTMFTLLCLLNVFVCLKFRLYLKTRKILIKKVMSSKYAFIS